MLDLTLDNKYIYWSTGDLIDLIVHGNIKDKSFYHRLVGYSDIVIECLDNNPPRYIKNLTESNSNVDIEQFLYIKLSSVNLTDLLK